MLAAVSATVASLAVVLLIISAGVVLDASAVAAEGCACNTSDSWSVLSELYAATGGSFWSNKEPTGSTMNTSSDWLQPGSSVCDWYGVRCSSLHLNSRNLSGTIPASLGRLTWLTVLNLSDNNISGVLPPELGNLTHLTKFFAFRNRFSGTLPASFGAWKFLTHFDVSSNQLRGALPEEFKNWTSIAIFGFSQNFLNSTLPAAYGDGWGTHIELFSAGGNSLIGSLPESYGSWTGLVNFEVQSNLLSGSLPTTYKSWHYVLQVSISENKFTGALPSEYSDWRYLDVFRATHNSLEGTLPISYASWTHLTTFNVAMNRLSGTLPEVYGSSWARLLSFSVGSNQLTGPLPASYGTAWSSSLKIFHCAYNQLSGTLPMSYGSLAVLEMMIITKNNLSGKVPNSWRLLTSLRILLLNGNAGIIGTLPPLGSSSLFLIVSVCNTSLSLCSALPGKIVKYLCVGVEELITDGRELSEASLQSRVFGLPDAAPLNPCGSPSPPPLSPSSSASPSAVVSGKKTVAAAVAVGIITTVVAAVSVSPTGALSLRRLVASCGCSVTLHDDVDILGVPMTLRIGPDNGGERHRGAIVGNILLVAAVGFVGLASAAIMAAVKNLAFSACLTRLRMPGTLHVFVAYVFQPSLTCALLLFPHAASGSVVCGAAGVAACGAWIVSLSFPLLKSPFPAAASRARSTQHRRTLHRKPHGLHERFLLHAKSAVEYFCAPRVEWSSHHTRGEEGFVQQYGLLFTGANVGIHWWLLCDVATSAVVALLSVQYVASGAACATQSWLSVAVNCVHVALLAWKRPKHKRLVMCVLLLSNGAACFVALLCAVGVAQETTDAIVIGVAVVCGGASLCNTAFMLLTRACLHQSNRPSNGHSTLSDSSLRHSQRPALEAVSPRCLQRDATGQIPERWQLDRLEEVIRLICNARDDRQQ